MLHPNFVILGVLVFFFGSAGYFIETLQGKVKPNRVSWFIWILAPAIILAAQLKQGIGMEALMTFAVGFIPLMIFLASFFNKKAYWKIGKVDLLCGALSIIGLILWQITKVGNIAILLSIVSDLLAALPTYVKSWKEPETENYFLYFTNSLLGLITMLTIKDWNFAAYSFPVYMFIGPLTMAVIIKFKIGSKLKWV